MRDIRRAYSVYSNVDDKSWLKSNLLLDWQITAASFVPTDISSGAEIKIVALVDPSPSPVIADAVEQTIGGTAADETLIGTSGDDAIYGMLGNDTIYGGDGNDYLYGDGYGGGPYFLPWSPGDRRDDVIYGGAGIDTFFREEALSALTFSYLGSANGLRIASTRTDSFTNGTDILHDVEYLNVLVEFGGRTPWYRTIDLHQTKSNFNFGSFKSLSAVAGTEDGAGTSDLVLYNSSGQFAIWFVDSAVVTPIIGNAYLGQAPGWSPAVTGDFNADGVSDMILQNSGFLLNYRMTNAGAVESITYLAYVPGWSVKGSGDYNDDGRLDLVLQNGAVVINWIMGADGGVTTGNSLGTYPGWSVVGVGDFNRDGHADTLVREDATGSVVELLTNVAGGLAGGQHLETQPNYMVVGVGDFNGDGGADILIRHNDGSLVTWITAPDGGLAAGYFIGAPIGWTVVGTGDYNGDGTSDVALENLGMVVTWLLTDGHLASGNLVSASGAAGWSVFG